MRDLLRKLGKFLSIYTYDTLHKHKKGEFHYIQQVPSPIKNKKISKTLNRRKSSSYDGDFTYHFIMFRYQKKISRTVFS